MDTPAYLLPGMKNSPYLSSILNRLYTSVIVLNPENNALEVSWSTDMSPTTIFNLAYRTARVAGSCGRGGRGVPGVWDEGGYREGLYRVLPGPSHGPIFSHILASGPYPRPNKALFTGFHEVS